MANRMVRVESEIFVGVCGFTVNTCFWISPVRSMNIYIEKGETSFVLTFKGELDRWLNRIQRVRGGPLIVITLWQTPDHQDSTCATHR